MSHPALERLRERRFVSWTLAYVAGSWVALQILDFLRENFGWGVGLVRASTIMIVAGFVVHLIVIWFHGEQGRQRIRAAEVVLITVVLAVGGVTANRAFRFAPGNDDRPRGSTPGLVAVLPFANATGDRGQDFYAEGVTRELIGILADAGVRVLGFRAVEPYAATHPDRELAELLRVDAIAVGSLQRSGSVIQIGAELLDPYTGETLWADVMSGEASDILRLQSGLARAIADRMQSELSPGGRARLSAGPVVNPDAYAQYLLGRQQMLRWTEDGFERSARHLEDAISLDPTFAPAWASLAVTYCYALFYAWVDPVRARQRISHAVSEAIALDPDSGEGLAARGWASLLLDWDFQAAEEQLSQAGSLSRSVPTLYPLFLTHWYSGRFEEAGEVALELTALEPTTAAFHSDYGWSRWSAGDMTGAREAAARAIDEDPTFFEAHHLMAHTDLGTGRYEEARTGLERARALAGGDYHWRWALDGAIRAAVGDTAGVHQLLAQMGENGLTPRFGQRAELLFHIGLLDSAFVMVRRAVDTKDIDGLLYLRGHRSVEPWRSEPAFLSILTELGLER